MAYRVIRTFALHGTEAVPADTLADATLILRRMLAECVQQDRATTIQTVAGSDHCWIVTGGLYAGDTIQFVEVANGGKAAGYCQAALIRKLDRTMGNHRPIDPVPPALGSILARDGKQGAGFKTHVDTVLPCRHCKGTKIDRVERPMMVPSNVIAANRPEWIGGRYMPIVVDVPCASCKGTGRQED